MSLRWRKDWPFAGTEEFLNDAGPFQLAANAELFAGLERPALESIMASSATVHLSPGATLFSQGDSPKLLFLVLAGRIKVSLVTEDGTPITLRFMSVGDIVGCAAVFQRIPYPATATAPAEARLASWTAAQVEEMVRRHEVVARNALAIMGGRAAEFLQRFQEAVAERVEQRIARALLREQERAPAGEKDTPSPPSIALSRQELADLSGATLYTTSRILSAWTRRGMIDGGRGRIVIRDLAALAAVAVASPGG